MNPDQTPQPQIPAELISELISTTAWTPQVSEPVTVFTSEEEKVLSPEELAKDLQARMQAEIERKAELVRRSKLGHTPGKMFKTQDNETYLVNANGSYRNLDRRMSKRARHRQDVEARRLLGVL